MNNSYWRVEFWRITLVLFFALLIGMLSHFWLISLLLTLVTYIIWLLYKLNQLHMWIKNGVKPNQLPDSSGFWEGISQQILILKKQSRNRKLRMGKLLKRSRNIISAIPYATMLLNKNNEIEWANNISLSYLNVDIKKDRGQRIDNLIRLPEFREMLIKNVPAEVKCSLPQTNGQQLLLQLIPIKKNFRLLIAQDITERENLLQMRKNFIANASHELRTPLTVIAGYLEMMGQDDKLPENLKSAVNLASDQSARMQGIIEDLLILSHLENSTSTLQSIKVINVPSILEEICHNEMTLIEDESHTLEINIDSLIQIKGVEAEIISACSNLIHNSIHHTQAGTHITVDWGKKPSGEASLVVKDTGQGIPEQHLSHLTERFYRVDEGRSTDTGSTGLGLAIVQHVIQRHEGELIIQSLLGKGSTFTAHFPKTRVVDAKTL